MGGETDDAKVARHAGKLATWWDRARVSVLGVSIIVTIVTTAYLAGQKQTEIATQLHHTSVTVEEIRDTVKGHSVSIHEVSERLSKLETARDQQAENIRMFWSRDWSDLKHRVERIEQFILGKDTVRERVER